MRRMVVQEKISTSKIINATNGINYILNKKAEISWRILFYLSILFKEKN